MSAEIIQTVSKSHKVFVFALNSVLANEYLLFNKTLNYYWNITSPNFQGQHTFLGEQYKQILDIMDDLAERVRVLNERPNITIKSMFSRSEGKDNQEKTPSSENMFRNLLREHTDIQSQLKEIIAETKTFMHDPGTSDLLTSVLLKHEKMSWMIRSHIT